MLRPFCFRRITGKPAAPIFQPVGISVLQLDEVVMTLDRFEAMRPGDLDRLYKEQASEQMNVSRTTCSRIIDAAHRRIAEALVHGKALRIGGSPVEMEGRRCCRRHDNKDKQEEEK